ncbi:MAG: translation initiation factor IF-2 [Candidatus Taylorbacteria bacterium RIFCSPHIGHO2_01_FULL_51_15]|uniref:Translation initiation factor IF-2 n=1 Tax=Candidatus Taylorbacteria bacterium RIFCSPHIGHO2_01_FULL_51_15 TaxID=1802304 RepID=A0A1G2MBW2_9BACT|nr:MAG: translation initiation factor IF-2 [Candidatus Taylorbacteria bacterium RIFCSPHIGHO2_01_FULL_51_15]
MTTDIPKTEKGTKTPRPPVVAILGHVDHGKSTLLDYIRKTNVVEKEAGGITQHLGAYEVAHKTREGVERSITFLDTPGHEAFKGIRSRGATVADIGILIVSAEEGVKPQTVEALLAIKKAGIPYLVAATKIDKPEANVERTKQSLAEHEIYVEGYGGDVPFAAISSKTGEGVSDLLDLILLVAELHDIGSVEGAPMRAFVIESNVNKKKGIFATVIVKEGVLQKGGFLVAENAFTPTRRIENVQGASIEKGEPGMPVVIAGWSDVPRAGAACRLVETKREAEALVQGEEEKRRKRPDNTATTVLAETALLPLVIKADTAGSLEAVEAEVQKQATEKVPIKIVARGIGAISESDLKSAKGGGEIAIVGFNVGIDGPAKSIIERGGITVQTFDVIYALGEWVGSLVKKRTPKVTVTVMKANARILKIFTTEKDRQVIGGKVLEGMLETGDEFTIFRREALIGKGKIRELQRLKEKVSSVPQGAEFGAFVSTSIDIMPSDRIEAAKSVEQ